MNWFSRNSYKEPPPGWSKRALTYWDACLFGRNDSPTIGWVLEGNDVDTLRISVALEKAVQFRAPWLRGRLARTECGSPPFEVHVPSESSLTKAFNTTTSTIQTSLNTVIAYTPSSHSIGTILTTPAFDPTLLNPRTAIASVEEYILQDLPLLHLHFIIASDATLVSLTWSHAVMDALAAGELVKAWEFVFSASSPVPFYPDIDPSTLFQFTNNITVEPGWRQPGWITYTPLQLCKVLVPYLYESWRFPLLHGSIFIPSSLLSKWVREAKAEFTEKDEWVSRNDLVTAWIFKHAFGGPYFNDTDYTTLFTAICFRGRHPSLPREAITNTAKSHSMPPLTTLELRTTSLPQIALKLRKSMEVFNNDEEFVGKCVAHEVRMMEKGNGKTGEIPVGRLDARAFGVTSWAKLGFGEVSFGGRNVVATLTYNTGRGCATIVEEEEGVWRVDYKLSARQWDVLKEEMERENEELVGKGV